MKRRKSALWITYGLLALMLAAIGLWRASAPQERRLAPQTPPAPTASPAPTATPSPAPGQPSPSPAATWAGPFELPLEGATGYASIALNLREAPSAGAQLLRTLPAGTGFRIVGEEGAYWRVAHPDFSGYVAHRYCMVNLPDILPSIVYENTNASASIIQTSGKQLPGITGEKLYEGYAYNGRLGKEEFIMPVLYHMAKKIAAAQQAALSDGNSLKIYEAYRPYSAQRSVVDALNTLAQKDPQVQRGIGTAPWKVSWFAAQGLSNHQRGCAIDVSLVQVSETRQRISGPYAYLTVQQYAPYHMPTPMHELSIAAAAFQTPVPSSSKTAWRSAAPAANMNDAAKRLQRYCTDAGLTPLASEWWHFNDLDAYDRIKDDPGEGALALSTLYSQPPSQ